MTITTRLGKGSALDHQQMDANFTTLGLAHGDTDISGLISTVFDAGTTWTGALQLNSTGNMTYNADGYIYLRTPTNVTFVGNDTNFLTIDSAGSTMNFNTNNNELSFDAISIRMNNLPTTQPGISGYLWNDSGTIKIS